MGTQSTEEKNKPKLIQFSKEKQSLKITKALVLKKEENISSFWKKEKFTHKTVFTRMVFFYIFPLLLKGNFPIFIYGFGFMMVLARELKSRKKEILRELFIGISVVKLL